MKKYAAAKPTADDTLRYVEFTLAAEGMELTEQTKRGIKDCASGKVNAEQEIQLAVSRYKSEFGNARV